MKEGRKPIRTTEQSFAHLIQAVGKHETAPEQKVRREALDEIVLFGSEVNKAPFAEQQTAYKSNKSLLERAGLERKVSDALGIADTLAKRVR